MFCDILIKNANIITMSYRQADANWIAITDDKIVAIGIGTDMPEAKHVYDMRGKTILPGFIDTHVHGTLTGEFLKSADLNKAKNVDSVIDTITGKMEKSSGIVTAGCFSKEGYTGRMFTAEDLDEICSDKVLLIYDKSYHGCYLNTKGLEAAGVKPGMETI